MNICTSLQPDQHYFAGYADRRLGDTERKRFFAEIIMKKRRILAALAAVIFLLTFSSYAAEEEQDHIKWVDFTLTAPLLKTAAEIDIETYGKERHVDWIELLACLAARCGGEFEKTSSKDAQRLADRYLSGESFEEMANNRKLFDYYKEAYAAALGGLLSAYTESMLHSDGTTSETVKYGICASGPLAAGYTYSHFDDFGLSRDYGYKRRHLGHDMMGSVGTPVTAMESGYVEVCGWNQYGGWRVGIRSFDGKRYYYYAHLRRGHPYCDLYEGKIVTAGEVIGYLGMTGYSAKEDVNNISIPHLHFGLELIFAPEQKDGWNQIWIDVYELVKFLEPYRVSAVKCDDGDYRSTVQRIPVDFWE